VTPNPNGTAYDVIVVGSGAAGGQSAYALCMEGAKVLMLEPGADIPPKRDAHVPDPGPGAAAGCRYAAKALWLLRRDVDGGWEVPRRAHVRTSEEAAGRFDWWRARMLGVARNHWGRISLRYGPYDFKPRSRDGLGSIANRLRGLASYTTKSSY